MIKHSCGPELWLDECEIAQPIHVHVDVSAVEEIYEARQRHYMKSKLCGMNR